MTIAIIAVAAMFLITIGSLAVLGAFLTHLHIESPKTKASNSDITDPSPNTASSAEEEAKLELAKRRAAAEEEAFQQLMNYNVDIAYGIKQNE